MDNLHITENQVKIVAMGIPAACLLILTVGIWAANKICTLAERRKRCKTEKTCDRC